MANISHIFGDAGFGADDAAGLHASRPVDSPADQLAQAMAAAGMQPPEQIIMDGAIHRFSPDDRKERVAWYVAFGDGIPAGRFGDWRTGSDHGWQADVGRTLSLAEAAEARRRMEAARAMRDEMQRQRYAEAARLAQRIWDAATPAPADHPYLLRKSIEPHGLRVAADGRLVAPMYAAEGGLASIQYIADDGAKRFLTGGRCGGSLWCIGSLTEGVLYIAEGVATAATVAEATGRPCVVAFSAANLPAVAQALAATLPGRQMVIVADHDQSGTGERYAAEAAAATGASVVMPPEIGDVNDYAAAGGDVRELLGADGGDLAAAEAALDVVWGDQLPAEYEAPDELIEGLLVRGGTSVLYGDSNSGKTFLAISMAAAIASGTNWHGRRVEQGVVVYLATESPASVRTRLQAIQRSQGLDISRIAVVQVPVNFHSSGIHAVQIIELCRSIERQRGEKVQLIIGDTLARMSAGANENSGEDMAPVMARFDALAAETGAAVMIIHHSGKDAAKGSRGWSGIRAHIDTELEVVERDGSRSVAVTKQRELASKGAVIGFALDVVEMGQNKWGEPATTCVAVPSDAPAPARAESKADRHRRLMESAWVHGGSEERDDMPYLSRSAFADYCTTQLEMKPSSVQQYLKPSAAGKPIHELVVAGILRPHEQGWVVCHDAYASAMLLDKNTPNPWDYK